MLDVYRGLAKAGDTSKVLANLKRIIISSGDLDSVVNLQGTEAAVKAIGFPLAEGGDHRPWFYNATGASLDILTNKPIAWGPSLQSQDAGMQVGGFVTNYDTG